MLTAMLWHDNSQTALNLKVQKAADYYYKKYGRAPDFCLINPSMLNKTQKLPEIKGLAIRLYRSVLPGHLWIGIEDKPDAKPAGDD